MTLAYSVAVEPMDQRPARIRARRGRRDRARSRASRSDRHIPPASGRRTPTGGIDPVRSRRTTFSQVSAWADRLLRSSDSRLRPPVLRRSLWQVRQYCLRAAACCADGETADAWRRGHLCRRCRGPWRRRGTLRRRKGGVVAHRGHPHGRENESDATPHGSFRLKSDIRVAPGLVLHKIARREPGSAVGADSSRLQRLLWVNCSAQAYNPGGVGPRLERGNMRKIRALTDELRWTRRSSPDFGRPVPVGFRIARAVLRVISSRTSECHKHGIGRCDHKAAAKESSWRNTYLVHHGGRRCWVSW